MKSTATPLWVEVAKILGVDTSAQVLCPECQKSYLKTNDSEAIGNKKELTLFCEQCGARNFMRMNA